ncbi:MAG: hypothetical protein AAFP77_22595 [Bacteroidota bacterium]
MTNFSRFSLLFLVALFLGCGDDDENVVVTGDGLLAQLERASDGVSYEWTDFAYDADQNLTRIETQLESFLQTTYESFYEGGEAVSLRYVSENSNAGNTITKDYDLIREGNEIKLRNSAGVDEYVYQVTAGYIDNCKAFYGPNNEYFNETVFIRNADNNIEKIAYFATDASSTDLKVYEYTFSDYASDLDLPGAYNPVLGFNFTGFPGQFGEVMGLKISNQLPMKSSYWDAGGTFREENLSAVPVVVDGVLQEISYTNAGIPNNNYQLKLTYN